MLIKYTLLSIFIYLSSKCSYSQSFFKKIEYSLQTGFLTSSQKNNPFFLYSNTFGTKPLELNNLFFSSSLQKEYDSLHNFKTKLKKFDFGYGLNFQLNYGHKMQFLIPETYFKIKFNIFELYLGRRKEIFGLTDTTLTSGSYIWSGNALPVPKIQISTPNWVGFGLYKRVSFKAGLSHGWFGTQGIIENYYLHQKWLYLKINDKKNKIQLIGGVNHQTQWGGYSDVLKNKDWYDVPTINGYLAPYPLYSFKYILIPFLQKIVPANPQKVPFYDAVLAIGNQLGSVDIEAIFENNFRLYHQKPFDFARSLINFNNFEDGIYGISWLSKNSVIRRIVGEFIYTKSQGRERFGKNRNSNNGEVDNYFFHGQYQSWTYQSRIIGTPFIIVDPLNRNIVNNRLKAYYFGLNGVKKNIDFTIKFAHSINYGTYINPVLLKSNSILLKVNVPLIFGIKLNSYLATDFGEFYKNTSGFQIGFEKCFN